MPSLGPGTDGTPPGELRGGGEEAGGDVCSFVASGGEEAMEGGFWSSGVEGPERIGGKKGSSDGGGEVGRGGGESSFGERAMGKGGGDVGRGGAGDSGGGGEAGGGGAGSSGGGGEEGICGAGSFGAGGPAGECSLKQTHLSSVSSPAGGATSGPKMLSRSAMEGFLLESFASADASEIETRDKLNVTLFIHFQNVKF